MERVAGSANASAGSPGLGLVEVRWNTRARRGGPPSGPSRDSASLRGRSRRRRRAAPLEDAPLGRVARNYKNDKRKLGTFHLYFYAINKDGAYGSASLWRNGYEPNKKAAFAVNDGSGSRLAECSPFFDEVSGDQ